MTWAKFILFASVAASLAVHPSPAEAQFAATVLAPTGTLRAAFLGDNPALGRVDPNTGNVTGPVADLVKELARRLNVPYALIPSPGTPDIIGRLNAGTADLGFFAYNARRAMDVEFSPPWLLMPNSYIVRSDSPIQRVADADRTGVHIAAVKSDTQDVFLSANLKNTRVEAVDKMPAPEEIEKMLLESKIDAFAANRQRLFEIAARFPQLRVVGDDYFVAGQAIAVVKNNAARLAAIDVLLDEVLATSVVKDSIERAGLHGVNAAPPRGH
jgi:polar amino acid transport system substrate-binding protein